MLTLQEKPTRPNVSFTMVECLRKVARSGECPSRSLPRRFASACVGRGYLVSRNGRSRIADRLRLGALGGVPDLELAEAVSRMSFEGEQWFALTELGRKVLLDYEKWLMS